MSRIDPKVEEMKIKEEFSARYQELANQTESDPSRTLPNPYENVPTAPFEDPTQQVVLLNITHRNQVPKSKLPGFRVCGAFENVDKLKRHALSVGGPNAYGGATLVKADAHKKFLICSSIEKQQDSAYVMKKIDDITQRYLQTLNFHNEEFKENKEKRQQGKTGLSKNEKVKKISSRKQLLDTKFDTDSSKGSETGNVSRNAEVRSQAVAVVTIIEDNTPAVLNGHEDPEPIVIVWGCFENESMAKAYIYSVASSKIRDVTLDVVNMYEWVFPTEISKHADSIAEEYRNPTLNKVMNSRKKQKASVMSYEEWCQKEGQAPASIEINAIKESEESTDVKTEVKKTEDFKVQVAVADASDKKSSEEWKTVTQAPSTKTSELFKEVTFADPNAQPSPLPPPLPVVSSPPPSSSSVPIPSVPSLPTSPSTTSPTLPDPPTNQTASKKSSRKKKSKGSQ